MEKILKDRYSLERVIRSGGFGTTWYGRDLVLEMPVAVKAYKDEETGENREKFLKEARKLARFSKEPGIVNVRDFLDVNGVIYLIMEYVEGEDLAAMVSSGKTMSFAEAWKLLEPMVRTVGRLHQEGMIHRDISPDNIRILPDGSVKLLDFGSALVLDREIDATMTVAVKKGYAPYEQYMDKSLQGPWTDVYAVCGTIYKCITGVTPPDALTRGFQDTLQRPSALGAEITSKEEDVLLAGLAVKAENRLRSVDELIQAVEAAESPSRTGSESEAEGTFQTGNPAPVESEPVKKKVLRKDPAPKKNFEQESTVKNSDKKDMSPSEIHKQKKKGGRKRTNRKKVLGIGIGLAAVVIVAAVLVFRGSGNPYESEYSSEYSRISEKTVTVDMLKKINNSSTTHLSMSNCEISDEVMEYLADMDQIEDLTLQYCSGFSTLEPVSGMEALTSLYYTVSTNTNSESITVDGSVMFDGDFSDITDLYVSYIEENGDNSYLENFSNLESLTYGVEGAEDPSFLTLLTELRRLYVGEEKLDFSGDYQEVLASLTQLEKLECENTGLAELTSLQNLENLKSLKISKNPVTDLTPLQNLKNLEELYVNDARITDLTPLAGSSNLTRLKIENNAVTSLTGLENAENLSELYAGGNQITDLIPLSGCSKLWKLEVADNQLTTLAGLENSTGIVNFDGSRNNLTDAAALAGNTEMSELTIAHNQLANLDFCEKMTALVELYAQDNQIADISALTNASNLEKLNLGQNQISDISALDNSFTSLTRLNVSENQLSSIEALAGCTGLEAVMAEHNQLTSLKGLENKSSLYAVLANDNQIRDLSGLEGSMEKILYLDLGNNEISDLTSLKSLTGNKLVVLLENNQISDITPLPVQAEYTELSLYGNRITDYSHLRKFTSVNSYFDTVYVGYTDNLQLDTIAGSDYCNGKALHVVDLPLNMQAQASSLIEETEPASGAVSSRHLSLHPVMQTSEEADAELEELRSSIRDQVNGSAGDEDAEDAEETDNTEEAADLDETGGTEEEADWNSEGVEDNEE